MNAQILAVPRGVRWLKYMYGAVTQIELKNVLEVTSMDTEARK
jgi:hypothetical protein